MYALLLDTDNRILSATLDAYAPASQPRVSSLPSGDIHNYKYINEEFVSDPLPTPEEPTPLDFDAMDAQITYTALMTDTLIEEE